MTFRRKGKELHEQSLDWRAWLDSVSTDVDAAGLPGSVVEDEDAWWYFLSKTYSRAGHLGQEAWFAYDSLGSEQRAALWRLIRAWLRARWPDAPEHSRKTLETTYGTPGPTVN